jgi:hypothetical protein
MKKCSYCGAEYSDDISVCALDQTSLDVPPSSSSFSFPWAALFSWGGLVFGMLGTASAFLNTYPYYFVHHDIGPGMIFYFLGLAVIAIFTLVVGLPCAIVGIIKRRRLVGWLGVIFALAPAPLGLAMLKAAMIMNGFHFD